MSATRAIFMAKTVVEDMSPYVTMYNHVSSFMSIYMNY